MGKTRDLFKKIRDTEGTFHAKMGWIKDGNGLDLTEAEDIKKRGKNTQKNFTKDIQVLNALIQEQGQRVLPGPASTCMDNCAGPVSC